MLSRRSFGQALTAFGALLATHLPLALAAPTEVFEDSPLFPVGTRESFLLRVADSGQTIGPQLIRVDGLRGRPVADSLAAEQVYKDLAPALTCASDGLGFQMLRGSSDIARASKRGFANRVIVHPDNVERLASLPLHVFARSYMPRHEALLFYRGEHYTDVPGVLVDGQLIVNRDADGNETFRYAKRLVWS